MRFNLLGSVICVVYGVLHNPTKAFVGGPEERPGLPAVGRQATVLTRQVDLVEHSPLAAHEGVVRRLHQSADVVCYWLTHVEHLAVVVDVGVVAVGQVVAGEGPLQGLRQTEVGAGGQLVGHPGGDEGEEEEDQRKG